jgi:RES domain-containing protein
VSTLFRGSEWNTPLWRNANRGAGRYNYDLAGPTQYLALHPLTVYAERLRSLGPAIIEDLDTIEWRLWVLELNISDLPEITFDNADTFGVTPDQLVDDDWTPCQELGDRLRVKGEEGIVVPSAALPGTRNAVLFGPRVISPYLAVPIDPDIEVAGAHAAERSAPPVEVVPLVRWQGATHAALEAWRAGDDFVFSEPPVVADGL